MSDSYIALDLETTGLDPKRDRIIEIGALRIADGEIVDRFAGFVNPHRRLSQAVTELTGIRDGDLASASEISEILPFLTAFFRELPLLGHNILFDFSFLKRAAVNNGFQLERSGIDTLKICRQLMPGDKKKNLAHACEYFGVKAVRSHRALDDAMSSHLLYRKLRDLFGEERPELFQPADMVYKVKKEQPASKRQKEHLRELVKYHKITLTVEIDSMTRNEISRITDKIISQYGRI